MLESELPFLASAHVSEPQLYLSFVLRYPVATPAELQDLSVIFYHAGETGLHLLLHAAGNYTVIQAALSYKMTA